MKDKGRPREIKSENRRYERYVCNEDGLYKQRVERDRKWIPTKEGRLVRTEDGRDYIKLRTRV